MNLLRQFIENNKQQQLFTTADHLLLAVSGGIDSVVLCELCKQAGFRFSIVHCNFQLRGEESKRDETFVLSLGKKYNVPVLTKQFDTTAFSEQQKCSVQEAARTLRYEWFAELIETATDAERTLLLTAHHADDNIETVTMLYFRGTGLQGLTGIPVKNEAIRRPLLPFYKEVLQDFAHEHQLQHVEDSSNESSKYTRNFFRNEILPAISKVYPQVKVNISNNISRFNEIESLYQLGVDRIIRQLCKQKGNEWHIPVKQLLSYKNKALVFEIFRRFGFMEKQVEEILKLTQSQSGKYLLAPSMDYRVIRHRHWLIISPVTSLDAAHFVLEKNDRQVAFSQGALVLDYPNQTPATIPSSGNEAWLDIDQLEFPLLLRRWKEGDYFYPLGMKKKKKIARFLIDQKLSKTQKEQCWVLESNKKITWVLGQRIDDRFKISDKTKSVLRIHLQIE